MINSFKEIKQIIDNLNKVTKEQLDKAIQIADKDLSKLEIEEDIEHIKWERDYYKLRFEELNKNWNKVIHTLLGEDYYNYGCDWKTCDDFTAEDLIYKYKKRWWQFWKKI